ncbi:MAG: hypothetical protein PHN18_09935 [Sulfurospirillaceae bacterium]|nr:hypothetical protein [Sulfurospirillaceae bacterium]MDD2827035.1 hypothetical protein [Sulfurospirillaceae bacterium]
MNRFLSLFGLLVLFVLSTGCATHQEKVSEVLQSHGATQVNRDYKSLLSLLVQYKEKLDLRNPSHYSKTQKAYIYNNLQQSRNTIRINYNNTYLKTYDDYLRIAFDKNPNINDRNDFLILGLHKLIWETYQRDKGHQLTTLSYQKEEFKRLYYYLEVIRWKIRTAKDTNGNYLFITWQNNWQIELEKKIKQGNLPSWQMIENLPSLLNNTEMLYSPSNFNFEVLLSQMIFHVKNSARIIGEEPVDIGIQTMITFALFL